MEFKIVKIIENELKCVTENEEVYYPYRELGLLFGKENLIHRDTLAKNYSNYLCSHPYGKKVKTYISKQGIVEILTKGIGYNPKYKDTVSRIYDYFNVQQPEKETMKLLECDIQYIKRDGKILWSLNDINKKIYQKNSVLSFGKYKKEDKKQHYIQIQEFICGQYFNCIYIDEYLLKILLLILFNSAKFKNRFEYEKINTIRLLKYFDILKTKDVKIDIDKQTEFILEYIDFVPIFAKSIIRKKGYSNLDNNYEDYIQEGYVALIELYRKFNLRDMEFDKFKWCLYKMISVKITEYHNKIKQVSGVNESRNIKTKLINVNLLIEKIYKEKGYTISLEEACQELRYTDNDIKNIIAFDAIGSNFEYLDATFDTNEIESCTLYDVMGNIDIEYQRMEDKIVINKLLTFLNQEQIKIITDFYYNNMNYSQIANKYHNNRYQIKGIIEDYLLIMRENF
jgi:RNA polymerase sigma factor (sigma-70 family)